MPQLPTYTAGLAPAPIAGGRRAESSDFRQGDFGASGRGIQQAASALMSDFEEQEQRRALISATEVRAKYAKALDEAAISGAPLEPLKAQMEAELAKVGENFSTKRGSESLQVYTANNNLMFDEQANRIEVQRAGAQARLDAGKFLRNEGQLVQSSNGAYLPTAIKNAEELASTFTRVPPHVRAEIADGLKKELNQAAALSSARVDPGGTVAKLEAGEWDLTPDMRAQALNYARTEKRGKEADELRARALEKEKRGEKINAARIDLFNGIQAGTVSWAMIRDDPRLQHPDAAQEREHLANILRVRAREAQGEEKKSNPIALRDAWLKIQSGEWTTGDKVIALVNDGTVNMRDGTFLMGLVAQQKDENGRSFGQRLSARMGAVIGAMRASPQYAAQPELAAAIQTELLSRAEEAASALRKDGKRPDSMFDPESKDYFFRPGLIKAVADDVQARQRRIMEETMPKVGDVSDISKLGLKEGDMFLDPKGRPSRVTPELLKAAGAKKTPGGPTASGRSGQ